MIAKIAGSTSIRKPTTNQQKLTNLALTVPATSTNGDSTESESISYKTLWKMIDYYRKNRMPDGNTLKFAHIELTELFKLLQQNGILDASFDIDTVSSYGLKIYMGNHGPGDGKDPDLDKSIPVDSSGNRIKGYIKQDTVIVCNTSYQIQQGGYDTWVDLLKTNYNVVKAGEIDPGAGLDKTTICPPDCQDVDNEQMDTYANLPTN